MAADSFIQSTDGIPDGVQTGYTSGLCTEFFRIYKEENKTILGEIFSELIESPITIKGSINSNIVGKGSLDKPNIIGNVSVSSGSAGDMAFK
jgi:hypothetical protein